MLVYLSAPYSSIENKEELMKNVMEFSGSYMVAHQGEHVVSPLFNHFSLDKVPSLGTDYEFWRNYSIDLLRRCDKIIVLKIAGWDISTGVLDEIKIATNLGIPVKYYPRNFVGV